MQKVERTEVEVMIFVVFFFFFLASEPGNFQSVIINDDLERAYREFKDTISEVLST